MFSYIHMGVTDFDRALAFYRPLMDGNKLCVACHAAPGASASE